MKRWGSLLVLVMFVGVAEAQEPAPMRPQPPPQADVIYDQAFAALTAGDFAAAERGFAYAATSHPDPEKRAAARELARLAADLRSRGAKLTLPGAAPVPEPPGVAPGDERDAGRASFIVTTTLASFYSGFFILDLLDADDVRTGTLVVMGSTAAGLLGSLFGTRDRLMTNGMADSYSLGIGVGVGNALLLTLPMDAIDESEEITGLILSGIVLGGAAGLYAGYQFRPTAGQVGYVADTTILGLASAGFGLLIVQPDVSADTAMLTLAAGMDLGMAFGIGTAGKLDWSTSRQRLVSLGIFLGAVAGFGTVLLIVGDDTIDDADTGARVSGTAGLVGVWGGFAATWYLTRNMKPDPRYRRPGVQVMPTATAMRDAAGELRPGLALVGTF